MLNEAYARQRIADYRRSQAAAAAQAQSQPRPFLARPARMTRVMARRLDSLIGWAG
jgi:hypothetical protein